jgi:hypothetical protein
MGLWVAGMWDMRHGKKVSGIAVVPHPHFKKMIKYEKGRRCILEDVEIKVQFEGSVIVGLRTWGNVGLGHVGLHITPTSLEKWTKC